MTLEKYQKDFFNISDYFNIIYRQEPKMNFIKPTGSLN